MPLTFRSAPAAGERGKATEALKEGKRSSFLAFLVKRGGEIAVAGWVWFGMQELAHLRLPAKSWAAVWVSCGLVWMVGAASRRWKPAGRTAWIILEAALTLAVLVLVGRNAERPLTAGQIVYAGMLLNVSVQGWRLWVSWRTRRGADPVGEPVRVMAVMALSWFGVLPFFSHGLLGGTDARWYAFMLQDFIDQLRAGGGPVFVGQGEFAWNGAVHPFRSAPVYMHVAGAWDYLTLRSLGVVSLQHLTVITSALVAGWGFYAAAVALAPRARWSAVAWTVLYVSAPAWLGVLYCADAYMTFMAMGAFPAVLYGNARTLVSEDRRGYGWLAAGLALVWMSHPPVAMLSTWVTVLLQGGSLLLGKPSSERMRAAAGGAVLFGGLAAYYFYSMSEVPRAERGSPADVLQVTGLLVTITGLAKAWIFRRGWGWASLVLVGITLAWWGRGPWLPWLMATTVFVAGIAASLRRWKHQALVEQRAAMILLAGLLAGAAVAGAWVGAEHPDRNITALAAVRSNAENATRYFAPVPAGLTHEGNFQPGQGLWFALAVLAVGFIEARSRAISLFFVATGLVALSIVPWPGVTDFLVGFAPAQLAQVANFPMSIRVMPVLVGFLAIGGVVWMAELDPGRIGWRSAVVPTLLMGFAGWGLWQSTHFMRRGWMVTDSSSRTAEKFRPENRILDRFAYDLLPWPGYLSHGLTDPWLEARILDEQQQIVTGPDQTAREMEQSQGLEKITLRAFEDLGNPKWIQLRPAIPIAPGERRLLRFQFDEKTNYEGWLIWTASRAYREYHLPDSGMEKAFGVGGQRSRVVSIVNSTDQPVEYTLSMPRGAGNSLTGTGEVFAEVFSSRYVAENASLRVESFRPFRVVATVKERGWIETPRVWLPGYRATVNGKRVAVKASKEALAMVEVGPGTQTLELRYVGTAGLWCALIVSSLTWLGWAVVAVRGCLRPRAVEASDLGRG